MTVAEIHVWQVLEAWAAAVRAADVDVLVALHTDTAPSRGPA